VQKEKIEIFLQILLGIRNKKLIVDKKAT